MILITEPIATVKTVAIGFWFPIGSRHEDAANRGATHFVEHMLFKGTSGKSAFDIACAFDRIGGYINAFTERDGVCLHATVPAAHLEYALGIICEMVTDSAFAQDDVDRERKVIESEIITSRDDPEEAAFDELYGALWPKQKLSQPIAATVREVRALGRDALYAWYRRFFAEGRLVVCICGSLDGEAAARVLEALPPRAQNAAPVEKPAWRGGACSVKAPFVQNQFFAAFPLAPVSERLYNRLVVLNAIIGDTMSSRLFQRLRERNGYCYTVYSFLTVFEDAAFWCAYASVPKKNTVLAVRELQDELEKLKEQGVTREETAAAKEHICGEEIIASEDVEARMKRLARLHFMDFPLRSYDEFCGEINAIDAQDLNGELRALLDFSKEAMLIYGGHFDWKKLK